MSPTFCSEMVQGCVILVRLQCTHFHGHHLLEGENKKKREEGGGGREGGMKVMRGRG